MNFTKVVFNKDKFVNFLKFSLRKIENLYFQKNMFGCKNIFHPNTCNSELSILEIDSNTELQSKAFFEWNDLGLLFDL